MKAKLKIVHRNRDGRVFRSQLVKDSESASDRLLNMLLSKDIVLLEGDTVTVEVVEDKHEEGR